jgi:hypothetical protein
MKTAELKIQMTADQMHHVVAEASVWPWWRAQGDVDDADPVWFIDEVREGGGVVERQIDWERGITMLLGGRHGCHTIDLRLFDVENGGFSDSADKFLQLCVFGDVVYG